MTTMESLNVIFRMAFDDQRIQISPNDIDGWDSLSHINHISAVESSFGVRFSQKGTLRLRNIGDLHNLIGSKRKQAST